MNTGAFGEGFPYTNFHDLNMDWIIKIAKDFLDQYTHIQELITNGEESLENITTSGLSQLDEKTTNGLAQLQDKADELEALLQAWYNNHSEDIANQLATALVDIASTLSSAKTDFSAFADQKTASVIASIPEDYTALSNAITSLVEAIAEMTSPLTPTAVIDNRYCTVGANNAVVLNQPEGSTCAVYDVSNYHGKALYINTQRLAGDNYWVFYVISNGGTAIGWATDIDNTLFKNFVTIPDNATTLYVNFATAGAGQTVRDVTTGSELDNLINYSSRHEIELNAIIPLIPVAPVQIVTGRFVALGSSGLVIFENVNSNVNIYQIEEYANKNLFLDITHTTANNCQFIVTDGTSAGVVASIYTGVDLNRYILTLPANSKYLYINYAPNTTPEVNYIAQAKPDGEGVDIGVNERIINKTCVCFGDSITYLDGTTYESGKESGQTCKGYESYLRDNGMSVTNKGYSGQALPYIVSEGIMNYNFSAYDYVTINSGANDSRKNVSVGTIQPIGSTYDTTTFIGALQAGIDFILSAKSTIKILLITPLMGWIYAPDGYDYPKQTDGIVEEKYATAMIEVGKLYGIPVCDLYHNDGLNILTRNWYINDPEPNPSASPNPNPYYSLHPTNAGYKRMAEIILSSIRLI